MNINREFIFKLNEISVEKSSNPFQKIDFNQEPNEEIFWLPKNLISLYNEQTYEGLNEKQRIYLSQLEFSVLCSVSCFGEKEVISNISKIMLKNKFSDIRSYLHHLISEENNHIAMFAEFCSRYGMLFPSHQYTYARGNIWNNSDVEDLMTFLRVLIFEELGDNFNRVIAQEESIPKLIRDINQYHRSDEGRHISFGRSFVDYFFNEIKINLTKIEIKSIQQHILDYISTRHYDYHNLKVYNMVGVKNAFNIRDKLVRSRGINFFARGDKYSRKKILNFMNFLGKCDLIDEKQDINTFL